jgi:hypothetical protein
MHLSWIGFESRRADDPFVPTITAATLASLRTGGDPNGPLDPKTASAAKLDPTPTSHAQFAWIKLCLDEAGAIATARVTETTSHEVGEGFKGAMMTWTFKPFMLGDHAIPACAMLRLAYPVGQGPAVETLPMPSPPKRGDVESIVFASGVKDTIAKRVAGEKLIVPDDATKTAINRSHGNHATGTFRVCMDEAGDIVDVLPMRSTGFASYDREIITRIRDTWHYSPFVLDGKSRPVCTAITFI